MEIINPIYEELNDDGVIIPSFIEVLAKKTIEESVIKNIKKIMKLNLLN